MIGIKRIRIENFKSFEKLDVVLGEFNILVGPNASGKSNFIHIFEFLRDAVNFGLENAMSMQGGGDYFRNIGLGSNAKFLIEVTYGISDNTIEKTLFGVNPTEIIYMLSIEFLKKEPWYEIHEEEVRVAFTIGKEQTDDTSKPIGNYRIIREKDNVQGELNIPKDSGINEDIVFPLAKLLAAKKGTGELLSKKELLLASPLLRVPFNVAEIFKGMSVYNFDPRLPKNAIPITGKTGLEEDGSNLAIVLNHIFADQTKKAQFSEILKDVLSFVESLAVEKQTDGSLLFKLQEAYSGKTFLPASLLSDGTINITALILALFYNDNPIVLFEEPERNIHPHLISKITAMMKERSKQRQIIVTTHNLEILRQAEPEDILFIARDSHGFSQITRPCEDEQVKIFLANEMGMDELYVQNLLRV